jgi:ABC-type phosphate transport system permease subunit
MTPPPATRIVQQTRDSEHIRLLSIFHFVVAGFALLAIAFLILHYWIMHSIFANPEMWKSQKNPTPPPQAIFDALIWFYAFGAILFVIACALNVLSGLFLWRRKHRVFSLVIGGLNCLQIPIGTVLGVFTIVVLSRDSVRELYGG